MRKEGFKEALELFRVACRRVSAYKDFLKRNGVNPEHIRSEDDFSKLPVTDKKQYIQKYSPAELSLDGKVLAMANASSGSSGKPTFWFTGDSQEKEGGRMHEVIFHDIFGIKKGDPTLMINCFSMGIWVAGTYTLAACRSISRNGYRITTVSPGIEKESIVAILRDLAPQFKRVILAGYPPFIMDLLSYARLESIVPANMNIITAGDKISEEWRSHALRYIKAKGRPASIVNIYGCADAGMLGHETPVSIDIRQESHRDKRLRRVLFGDVAELPTLVQYYPRAMYFEQEKNNLIFTARAGIPLVRYNINDVGRIISNGQMRNILGDNWKQKHSKQWRLEKWKLPFVVRTGRTDVAVTFYALNIYPENINAGLEDVKVRRFVSGQFFAFTKVSAANRNEVLYVNVELAPGVTPKKSIGKLIQAEVHEHLSLLNFEYKKLHSSLGDRALPVINLFRFGSAFFRDLKVRGILYTKGKKPVVIGN